MTHAPLQLPRYSMTCIITEVIPATDAACLCMVF